MRFAFITFVLIALLVVGMGPSYAGQIVTFGPRETKIEGSIPYSVIGKYKAQFGAFKGKIILDDRSQQVQSVYLSITPGSIRSNCPWCDKIVCSRRLLDIERYPKVIFKSFRINRDNYGYKVTGVLEMHGIRKIMTFPFDVKAIVDRRAGGKFLDINGVWRINRKDFHIVWSKLLDRGGVLVGDYLTVDWAIKVFIKDLY